MITRTALAAMALCVGACASSGPEQPSPAVASVSAGVAGLESDTSADAVEEGFYALDAGGAPRKVVVLRVSDSSGIVCRREKPTGSKFSRKVCRTRAEIEARAERDQKWWHQKFQ